MSQRITRRTLFRRAAVGAAAAAFAPGVLGANEKLHHACIGVGGMGSVDLRNVKGHGKTHIAAICDVDRHRLEAAAKLAPDARKYTDWRELLEREGDKIDSVNVTVPDHMHAAITMAALRAGKHVYCQKPLCHDVAECRAVAEATRRAGVVTQLGTQTASGIGDRMAVQFLRQGVVGKVERLILCSNRPGAIDRYRLKGPRPPKGQPPPDHLAWDLWLGTAPVRPYVPRIYHPTLWRAWQDFGTGWSGDIGCHIYDAVWKGLRLTAPRTVVAEVQKSWAEDPARRADNWPQSDHITWVFPGNEQTAGEELTVEWFDGNFFPPEDVQRMAEMDRYPPESSMAIGTKGALLLPHGSGPLLLPRERFRGHPRPRLRGRNHYHHFVNACLGGEMTESHFLQTGSMAEAVLLGTVAIRVPGEVLQWDAEGMKFPNAAQAERYLRRDYRDGCEVPGV
ncbi:MAG: Gfo/Idh/MocA family protein [Candidatus Brocadiia bacterium]